MKVALVGNQNSGKTTLFNLLTGMNAKIGNWPGVTIEKKIGTIKGTKHELIDLPGIYSLSPYSIEEEIARKFIFEEKPDVIINIVDATSLERSLYLTTQLLELDVKVLVALNMTDVLEKKGIIIDENELSNRLGTSVLKISALKNIGIEELISELNVEEEYEDTNVKIYSKEIENTIASVISTLPEKVMNKRFVAVKLLELDERFEKFSKDSIKKEIERSSKKHDMDLEEQIAYERYKFVEKLKNDTFSKIESNVTISDKLDKIFLNKWLALPIFVIIMFLIYYLSVGVIGSYTVDWVAGIVESVGEKTSIFLESVGTSEWLNSLVVDGIIAGVGAVLGFVPQLIILFICISLLETTGYMSRIALLFDRLFRKLGLSGKSLIPFIVGSGCSVPGIMGTRIIENQDEREMTAILTPFIPCSAKLPIITLFSSYFFGDYAGIASASLYFFAIFVIIFSALIMKKFIYKNTYSTYISELPEYRLPSFKYICKDVFEKITAFFKKAGSVILICSIIIWFLLSFSPQFNYGIDVEQSMLATLGKKISWIFIPMLGENSWGATVSAIQGLVAKEQVISSMTVIAGLSEEGIEVFDSDIFGFFSIASAYAFMVFNLFSAPCFGAIGALKRELGGNKKMFKAICFQTIIAWGIATLVYQLGSRIENGLISLVDIIIITIILLIIIYVLFKKGKNKECQSCPYCNSCDK